MSGMTTTTSRPSPPAHQRLRSVVLSGSACQLEAVVNEGSPDASCAALVCHPHPLGGGTMHNKVVYHAMKALNAPQWGLRFPVLRFNFRGTGRSQGSFDGAAEAGDVLTALAWLENEYRLPLVLVGFSFGAAMSLRACCSRENLPAPANKVRALAALGLPTRSEKRTYDYAFLADCRLPKFFLSGDRDQYAPQAELISTVAAAAEPRQLALVPGADHFFTGHLESMQSSLSTWLKEQVL